MRYNSAVQPNISTLLVSLNYFCSTAVFYTHVSHLSRGGVLIVDFGRGPQETRAVHELAQFPSTSRSDDQAINSDQTAETATPHKAPT